MGGFAGMREGRFGEVRWVEDFENFAGVGALFEGGYSMRYQLWSTLARTNLKLTLPVRRFYSVYGKGAGYQRREEMRHPSSCGWTCL